MKQDTDTSKRLAADTRCLRVISAGNLAYVCLMCGLRLADLLQSPSPNYHLAAAWLCIILTLATITYFAFSIDTKTFITRQMAKKVKLMGIIIGLLFSVYQWCILHAGEIRFAEPFSPSTALFFVMLDIMIFILLLSTVIRDAAKIKEENDLTI